MTINSVSANTFSNYRIANNYNTSTSTNTTNQATQSTRANGRPEGPPPGGPPPGGKGGGPKGGGPDLDTDSDGTWSTEEVEDYATYSASTLGIELDSDSIMSIYDTDGDGKISVSERANMGRDNALKLPTPQDAMTHMQSLGENRPNSVQSSTANESVTSDSESNAAIIKKLIMAYNNSNNDSLTELFSNVDYNV